MITIHTTADDLVKLRFAYRPLLEIPLSYRVLINPEFQGLHYRWVEQTRRVLNGIELPYMDALVTDHGYIPDFLTPTPIANRLDIEADFAELLATPDAAIREGVLTLIDEAGDSEMRRYFVAHPREAIWCLVEELRLYWQRTLAYHWSGMISTLEGDVLHHARMLVLNGPDSVFADLHPSITYVAGAIHLQPVCQHLHGDVEFTLRGDGIQLVPMIFPGCGRMYQVANRWQPMLAYRARGGGLWSQKPASQSLELALGAGRAQVLQGVQTPVTTSELAYKLQISSGAVSQQLSRLRRAGLVEPHRSGKRVYYRLTKRGEELIRLFERNY